MARRKPNRFRSAVATGMVIASGLNFASCAGTNTMTPVHQTHDREVTTHKRTEDGSQTTRERVVTSGKNSVDQNLDRANKILDLGVKGAATYRLIKGIFKD